MSEGEAKVGRPTKFRDEFVAQAEKLCALGATDLELADFFEINIATLYRWKHDFPKFCEALKGGKAESDERVQRSLYHKAVGYSFDSVKIMQYEGEPIEVPYREHVAPDTTAAIFWLKNRRPAEWRERHDVNHGIQSDNPLATFLDSLAGCGKTLQPVEEPNREGKDDDAPKFE